MELNQLIIIVFFVSCAIFFGLYVNEAYKKKEDCSQSKCNSLYPSTSLDCSQSKCNSLYPCKNDCTKCKCPPNDCKKCKCPPK